MKIIDARKRARNLINFKSAYGANIAANYKRYVKNTIHLLFEENPYHGVFNCNLQVMRVNFTEYTCQLVNNA